jgi:hypothetical protein
VTSGGGMHEVAAAMGEVRPRVGVSSCLLGQPVRFNGGHSRNRFVADVLARYVAYLEPSPAGLGLRNHTAGPAAPSGQSRQSGRGPTPKTPADATKGATQ